MKKTILVGLLIGCGFLSNISFAAPQAAAKATAQQTVSAESAKLGTENRVIKIALSHVVQANSPKGKAAMRFKELLEAKFPGRVSVSLYHNNALYKDKEELEALELGVVNILIPTTGKVAGAYNVPEFQIFDLPFLFSNFDDVSYFVKSPTGEKLLDSFNAKSKTIQALSFWPLDFRNYHGPVPFKSPEDFKKYSFRAESAGLIKRATETFGAKEAVVTAFSELPAALKKQGEIKLDAAETPFSNFWGGKLYESQPWITLTNHNFQSYVMLVNKRWLNALPPDIKAEFIEMSKEVADFHIKLAIDERETLRKDIEAKGVKFYDLTPEEKEKFKKSAVPVHQFFMDKINKGLLLESYETIKNRK